VKPIGRLDEVVIDCLDPTALAAFWQQVLGGSIVHQSDEWVAVVPDPTAHGITVSMQRVPESKHGKNRVHIDVLVDHLGDATAAAEAIGATKIGEVVSDPLGGFQVMADPEGNEFCLVDGPTPISAGHG
jgi:predicted enzyme related to lactoylglutathione lyase